MDILGNLSTLQTTLAALAGIAGVVFAFWRWARPRFKSVAADVRAGRDALVGREEVRDSITGKVLAPALPGIGVRMETTEQNLARLTDAFSTLAQTHTRVDEHDRRIKALEQAALERVAARADSVAAWRAMEAVASQTQADVDIPAVGEN